MLKTDIQGKSITIKDVKAMIAANRPFAVTYERCGQNGDGRPVYIAVYEMDGQRAVLRCGHQVGLGDTARKFNIWPGLTGHHAKYGDGRPVLLDVGLNK